MGGVTVALLMVTAALATSTSYVIQPELTEVARDLGSSVSTISVTAGSAIVGYLFGLVLLVPLVDHLRSNLLVAGQLTVWPPASCSSRPRRTPSCSAWGCSSRACAPAPARS